MRTEMKEKVIIYIKKKLKDDSKSAAKRCLFKPGLQIEQATAQGAVKFLHGVPVMRTMTF